LVIPFYLSSLRQIDFEVNTPKHSKGYAICWVLSFIVEFVKKNHPPSTGLMREERFVNTGEASDLHTIN